MDCSVVTRKIENCCNTKKVKWIIVGINEFARLRSLSPRAAFNYLKIHGGIEFMITHYEAEHLLSFDDVVDDLSFICANNGGTQ
jgi:hypothetical protein